jgi:hypothetical protein
MKDFFSNSFHGDLKGGFRSLVARPSVGGGILVQKVKKAFYDDETDDRTLSNLSQKGRTSYDFDYIKMQDISQRQTKVSVAFNNTQEELNDESKEIEEVPKILYV